MLYLVNYSTLRGKVVKGFIADILKFSAGFGMLIAATGLAVNYLYTSLISNGTFSIAAEWTALYGTRAADRYAQTASMFPVIVMALLAYLHLLNRAKRLKDIFKDRRMVWIAFGLASLFPAAMYLPWFRSFFELIPYALRDWGITAGVAVLASTVMHGLMRRYIPSMK